MADEAFIRTSRSHGDQHVGISRRDPRDERGAPKEVFALLTPKFEKQTGNKVKFTYAVITALREKLAAGEKADVLVLPVPVLDGLAKEDKVRADARATFGIVGISVVVKEGAPKPDISTKEKFKEAMLAAHSVVHATPGKTPSGTHMGKVIEQLGIADAMAKARSSTSRRSTAASNWSRAGRPRSASIRRAKSRASKGLAWSARCRPVSSSPSSTARRRVPTRRAGRRGGLR